MIHQFDYLFWCGDLNYRVNMEREQALNLIETNQMEKLFTHDQLQQEMKENRVFSGFFEEPITFKPTYRYNRGNRTYSSEKSRVPSWCDRILYHCLPSSDLTPIKYGASDSITTSDHSPIYATYSLMTRFPNIPSQTPPCKIIFASLKTENLFSKEPSNWSVSFISTFLDGMKTTSLCRTYQNPLWNESEIPKLVPIVCNLSFLEKQTIRVFLECNDEEVGQALISLEQACENILEHSAFSVPIRFRGVYQGQLSGSVQIHYEQQKEAWKSAKIKKASNEDEKIDLP